MDFRSDNVTGAHPKVLEALVAANRDAVSSYGEDPISERVTRKLQAIFETDCAVFPVATGTAANVLALSSMTPPWGAIFCHEVSHIAVDECGAPEFFTGGAKLVTLGGKGGKIAAAEIEARGGAGKGVVHHVQPAAVSITQATEFGAVYRQEEIAAVGAACKRHGLRYHMDGARFANALVTLNRSPADLTWRAGVEALSFGATKNGALGVEAVILFDKTLTPEFELRRKRGGHLFSKMRYLSAQLEAYLEGDLWLANARHANAMAKRLAEGLARLPGSQLEYEVETNEIFVRLPEPAVAGLEREGFRFYRWDGAQLLRLVAAWNTPAAAVDAFLAAAKRLLAANAA
ncbi:L-threonine aldolase [Hypericibacter adhaerens]|uniref:L-threonine aldolase n=1 Tax=Hypericibacter adhaerens TaxID=2602016 RepID=A0A5J6N976_9PROT|nr:low specificity L-threonine aldolase [Hypericibacter adhaerens]QEX23966.1 L-threonine aldolase [Hypericibacter adhaerens]